MKEQLLKLKEAALEEIQAVSAMDELDSIKVKYSGKKGIQILVKEKNLDFKDIECLYLGGGFGNYMNVKSSLQIGFLMFFAGSFLASPLKNK